MSDSFWRDNALSLALIVAVLLFMFALFGYTSYKHYLDHQKFMSHPAEYLKLEELER